MKDKNTMLVCADNISEILEEIISLMKENNLVCFQSRNDLPEAMQKYNRKRKNKLFTIDMDLLANVCKCLIMIGLSGDDCVHNYYDQFKKLACYPTNCKIKFFFLFKPDLIEVSMHRMNNACHGLDEEIYYSLDIGNHLHYESCYPISSFDLILEKYKLKQEIIKNFRINESEYNSNLDEE